MTVAECKRRMTYREFRRWRVFYERNPFGPRQEDYRAGILYQTLAGVWQAAVAERMHLPGMTAVFPSQAGAPARPQTPEEMQEMWRAHTIAMGGKIIEPKKVKRGK